MGCCHSEPYTTSTPKILNSLGEAKDVCPSSSSSVPITHPCRLTEFEDESSKYRLLSQLVIWMNRNMNSPLQSSEQESCRRPDPRTVLLLTLQTVDEVEQALVASLTDGCLSETINRSEPCAFKAIYFKRSDMKDSQLDVTIIEAALTYIIDCLHEHPNLVAALGKAKIGYHDKGTALEDVGVRMFVIKGFKIDNPS